MAEHHLPFLVAVSNAKNGLFSASIGSLVIGVAGEVAIFVAHANRLPMGALADASFPTWYACADP